ncbi:DUF6896 domain-containing protein [Hymenobacter persicinus]|uniref:DUF6896 domain-containing protein n=1 Tax=Hymenobacter persicinus TaxID=2025506 RepID=A0A4Q5LDI7_9BACT|nr:hypothetical protein [Hymenobacter persicinus]RYU81806.1 hypothetical protein EWM57_05350 [Hymenobacter persicinus]
MLSLTTAPPARWVTQDQLEESNFLCFWSDTLPYTFGARIQRLPEGPIGLGAIKPAVLSVSAEAGRLIGLGERIPIGTANQEAIGQFVIAAKEEQLSCDRPFGIQPIPVRERGTLTEDEQQLFTCIEHWVQQAHQLCSTLRDAFQLDFTRMGRVERNARMGMQGTVNGLCYAFHGIGCYFETNDLQVDVDFDSQGDWRGFDLWRVQTFIDCNYPQLALTSSSIEQGILELLRKKWLYQEGHSYSKFYYVPPVA